MSYAYDVFISYGSADKAAAADLAGRLRDCGLRVWFDVWEIQAGDSIQGRIDAGLEDSAVLVLCVSKHALGFGWAALEDQTFRFRDPLNRDRRFILVRMDDVPLSGILAQSLYVDWRQRDDSDLERLVRACRASDPESHTVSRETPPARWVSLGHIGEITVVGCHPNGEQAISSSNDRTLRVWNLTTGVCEHVLEGHTDDITVVAFNTSRDQAISGSEDRTLRVWNLTTGICEHVLEGETGRVLDIACHSNGQHAVSGSADGTLRVWNLDTGACEHVLEGDADSICSVACHPEGLQAISGSRDGALRVWNLVTGACEHVLEGHTDDIGIVAYCHGGQHAVSGSGDYTLRLWDLSSGACEHVLEGHTGEIAAVACHPDGSHALTGSADHTLRLWDLVSGKCDLVLKGHDDTVNAIAYHPDGSHALSGSNDRTLRGWDLSSGACDFVLEGHTSAVSATVYRSDSRHAISGADNGGLRVWNLATGDCERTVEGHTSDITAVAYHLDSNHAISGSSDGTLRMWDLTPKANGHLLEGHTGDITAVAYRPSGGQAISGSDDRTLRVWDLANGTCQYVLEGHKGSVMGVAYHPDGSHAISGSADGTLRVWDLAAGTCECVLEGHSDMVMCVAYYPDGSQAISGSSDGSVRVWNLTTSHCEHVLEGHFNNVTAVAYSSKDGRAISGSDDRTLRIWDLATGRCERVLEGHTGAVSAVAVYPDGSHAISGSVDGTLRVWNLADGICEGNLDDHTDAVVGIVYDPNNQTVLSTAQNGVLRIRRAPHTDRDKSDIRAEQISYTNAKVVLVGEHQVGKSGLALRLAHDRWEHTDSTIGAWATHFIVPSGSLLPAPDGCDDREIWLWDFGGQADQRLIHQLYLGDAAMAVFVFDGQREDTVARLWDWDRALNSVGLDFPKILAAGRTDITPVRLSSAELNEFCDTAGFIKYVETSAKDNIGCPELREAIVASIDWTQIPWRTSPQVFQRLKNAILQLKDGGRVLTSAKELRDWLPSQIGPFKSAELEAVIGLLASPGAILPLDFGDYVLLRPELLNSYAQCVIRSLRDDAFVRGCIPEERVLRGELDYPANFKRLPEADERIVLHAMHKQLVARSICLRDLDPRRKRPTLLVFPSYFRRKRPDRPGRPEAFMSYSFSGYLDEVYASLVVRLHHSEPFQSAEMWHNAADFTTVGGKMLGIRLTVKADGTGELELHCDAKTPVSDQTLLARYVQDHLEVRAVSVTHLRTYICPKCATPVENRSAAKRRLLDGKLDIVCVDCECRISLWDEMEQQLSDPALRATVESIRAAAQVVLDNEGLERLLVGEVVAIAARANQITREFAVSDHGIDMEIEFKADDGSATGKKLYLQLKSGDSHLRTRKRDGQRFFRIKKPRYADYWADQAFPVLLLIRHSSGPIEWMEIRDQLLQQRADGVWPPREIAFDGQRFDVMAVRRWRDQVIAQPTPRAD